MNFLFALKLFIWLDNVARNLTKLKTENSGDEYKAKNVSMRFTNSTRSKKAYIFSLVLLPTLLFNSSYGQIRGKVIDHSTKEPLIGATVFIKDNLKINDVVRLDGSYLLNNVPRGKSIVVINYVGYEPIETEVNYDGKEVVLDFGMKTQDIALSEVSVIAHQDGATDKFARSREKNSENIMNVMSGRTIERLPDITIASVLQRVSGVTLERTATGDARYAVIRGMDQRYNYTLVNGIKIPSPDNKYRYVPMDMFPTELMERLEVIKSLTPSMEGDAIGGAMNLVLKDASSKFSVNANVGTGYSQLLSDRGYYNFDRKVVNHQSPADINGPYYVSTPKDFTYKNFDYKEKRFPMNTVLGLTLSNRFLKKKQLGVVVAGSYQNLYRGSNNIWFRPNNQPQPGNVPSFDDIFARKYNTNQTRYGAHAKLDYHLAKGHHISLYNLFMELDETQYRHTIDTSLSIGRSGSGTGNTYVLDRSRVHDQSIYSSTLQGDDQLFKKLSVNWSAVYSLAKSEKPDWSEYQTVQVVGYDAEGNHFATPPVLNIPFYRIWTRNSDRNYAGYVNLLYKTKIFDRNLNIKVGGLYRDKFRDNHYNEWDLIPNNSSTGLPLVFDGVLSADKFHFNGTSAAQGGRVNPLTYTATEIIMAYYIQGQFFVNPRFEILGGVRVENTSQGWKTIQDPKITYGAIGDVQYQDILPSLHFKYKLTEKTNLRLSYFKALNRPGFFEYVPFTVVSDNFSLSGNPILKHATANNFDFRLEYFPTALDQVLFGAFYKQIYDPIETAVEFTGTSSATLKPFNFSNATNYGFEFALTKYWGHIGVSGNYTYTHSSITSSKLYYDKNYVTHTTDQTRPLQGQSPHVGNASLLYKNPKIGLDLQLAYVYTGRKIVFLSPYKDLDYWQRSVSMLDFSAEKRIMKKFTLYCKIKNILNTPIIVEIMQPNIYTTGKFALTDQERSDRITTRKDYYGQTYLAGLRYKF